MSLRSLLEYSQAGLVLANKPQRILHVYDVDITTANNGGACCLFTVPSDVSWLGIEMWGGGGSGGGGCCNFSGTPGTSGNYARRIISVASGQQWTICAGGSTNFTNSCNGIAGNGSYICRENADCMFVSGGLAGISRCGMGSSVYCCVQTCPIGNIGGATLGFKSLCGSGRLVGSRCYWTQILTGAPYAHPQPMITRSLCATCCGNGLLGGTPFPATGGAAAQHSACAACHCGGFGAGGLVQVYYMSDG